MEEREEKIMGIVSKMKNDVKKSGASKGKFIFFKEGNKTRIRFLQELDDGFEVVFHDSYERGINVPCQEIFGKTCKYCEDEDLRTRSQYAWCVYDYEAKEVKILMAPVNNCSPIPALLSMSETYGTITDRDYVISVTGKQQNKTFSVVPMDRSKFRNERAKPFNKGAFLKLLNKAYPDEDAEDDYEDEDYGESKQSKKNKSMKGTAKKSDDWEDDGDEEVLPYEDMTPRELFNLCKERNIDCVPKKPAKYYINLLEEYDEQQEDWAEDGDEDDDDWE